MERNEINKVSAKVWQQVKLKYLFNVPYNNLVREIFDQLNVFIDFASFIHKIYQINIIITVLCSSWKCVH